MLILLMSCVQIKVNLNIHSIRSFTFKHTVTAYGCYFSTSNMTSKKWLKIHGVTAKKLTILDALGPTIIPHRAKYIPILNKHVLSKVFDDVSICLQIPKWIFFITQTIILWCVTFLWYLFKVLASYYISNLFFFHIVNSTEKYTMKSFEVQLYNVGGSEERSWYSVQSCICLYSKVMCEHVTKVIVESNLIGKHYFFPNYIKHSINNFCQGKLGIMIGEFGVWSSFDCSLMLCYIEYHILLSFVIMQSKCSTVKSLI